MELHDVTCVLLLWYTDSFCMSPLLGYLHHTTLMSFHSLSRNLGQCLYTLYGTPLGPGSEQVSALLTVSLNSARGSSLMLNRMEGSSGVINSLQWARCSSLLLSLYVSLKCWLMTSSGHARVPVHFCLCSSLVNLSMSEGDELPS